VAQANQKTPVEYQGAFFHDSLAIPGIDRDALDSRL
jgi:hypothetical protein